MNLCSYRHDEVYFEGSSCPACDLIEQISEAENKIDDLKEKLEKLTEEK